MTSHWFSCRMFIGAEARLDARFDDVRTSLAMLIRGGLLERASGGFYRPWSAALAGGRPRGTAAGMPSLARVQSRDATATGDLAIWPLRWELTGPEGAPFPVLDADITLTPAGAGATLLAVSAVCRPPLGVLAAGSGQVIARRVAQATIQTFTGYLTTAVMHPAVPPRRTPPPYPAGSRA
jgi:hypothetical protein